MSKATKWIGISMADATWGCPHCGSDRIPFKRLDSAEAVYFECNGARCGHHWTVVKDDRDFAPYGFGPPGNPGSMPDLSGHPFRYVQRARWSLGALTTIGKAA